ncbi:MULTISPECIES: MMPL family transporter [unclassified Nocardia]|uniref:MMPL family transporter n=1 Tax=unclassified Nocardia TaxID=2637762 RepID=UPI001CE42B04|nr:MULTISPECIES: MMPL family transporter [unclassified Nocardia]
MAQLDSVLERAESARRLGFGYRWGAFVAAHWRVALGIWAVLLVACAICVPILENRLRAPDFTVDTAESAAARTILTDHFPSIGAEQDVIVFDGHGRAVETPEYRELITRVLTAVRTTHGVSDAIGPLDGAPLHLIADDHSSAIAIVSLDGNETRRGEIAEELTSKLRKYSSSMIYVGLTGHSPQQNDQIEVGVEDTTKAESIGMPVALLLLVLAMGAVVAAVVPVGVAVAGIAGAYGLIFLLSTLLHFDTLVLAVATMIGTGVGIDYSMFLVSRFREELAHSEIADKRAKITHAVAVTIDTTGRNILASGLIVMISLGALFVVRVPIFRAVAGGVAAAVAASLLVALTLLPAVLSALGNRINAGSLPAAFQPPDTRDGKSRGGWERWAHGIMRRPVVFALAATAALAVLALPLTGVKFGLDAGVQALSQQPSGKATQVIEQKFASGLLAPLQIVATTADTGPLNADQAQRAQAFFNKLSTDPRIAQVLPETADGRTVATVILRPAFDSPDATNLVKSLRADARKVADNDGPTLRVGGATAEYVDFSAEITDKTPLVFGLVLAMSLIFLIIVFRSALLPIEAIVMNLIAIAAAMGTTVAVFQWGLGESLFDFHSRGFIQVFLPTVVFATLFGLSMDYEVFLIGRIKEIWDRDRDNERAVAAGLSHTARPISTAAAIMVVVFGSFVTAHVLEDKQIGFSLAVAVAIDAVLVRLVLVPALLRLFGPWNWWLPRRPRKGFFLPSGTVNRKVVLLKRKSEHV